MDDAPPAPAGELALPKTQAALETLFKEVIQADAAPTVSQSRGAQELFTELNTLTQRWQQLQQGLPALNKTLHAAHLAVIRRDLAPVRDLNAADED